MELQAEQNTLLEYEQDRCHPPPKEIETIKSDGLKRFRKISRIRMPSFVTEDDKMRHCKAGPRMDREVQFCIFKAEPGGPVKSPDSVGSARL